MDHPGDSTGVFDDKIPRLKHLYCEIGNALQCDDMENLHCCTVTLDANRGKKSTNIDKDKSTKVERNEWRARIDLMDTAEAGEDGEEGMA